MSSVFHGGNTYIFYNEAADNTQPNNIAFKNIDQLGAFPQVKINSSNTSLETYNDEWTSVLSGNMTIDSVSIVVHYIADNDSHLFLDSAFANGTNFQIKVALYESQDSLDQHYVMLNGYISGYQDSADQNAVYDRTYTFTAEDLVARGTATDPATLHVGDYGVGSDGETTPHYEALNPTGNSFIKVSALREDNPIDVDMGGFAFVDNGGDKTAQLAITTENGLRFFAKNTDTSWTEFKSATQNDLTYVPLTRTVNGKALSSNITLSASDVSALSLSGGDPDPKSCSIQKQNSGMIFTSLSGGCADEKVTIHRRADCLCPEAG